MKWVVVGGLQHFSVSPRPLGFLFFNFWVLGLRVWGQGLTIFYFSHELPQLRSVFSGPLAQILFNMNIGFLEEPGLQQNGWLTRNMWTQSSSLITFLRTSSLSLKLSKVTRTGLVPRTSGPEYTLLAFTTQILETIVSTYRNKYWGRRFPLTPSIYVDTIYVQSYVAQIRVVPWWWASLSWCSHGPWSGSWSCCSTLPEKRGSNKISKKNKDLIFSQRRKTSLQVSYLEIIFPIFDIWTYYPNCWGPFRNDVIIIKCIRLGN